MGSALADFFPLSLFDKLPSLQVDYYLTPHRPVGGLSTTTTSLNSKSPNISSQILSLRHKSPGITSPKLAGRGSRVVRRASRGSWVTRRASRGSCATRVLGRGWRATRVVGHGPREYRVAGYATREFVKMQSLKIGHPRILSLFFFSMEKI